MKKVIICIAVLIFFTSSVFAVNFNPTLLKFSASNTIKYDFDGSSLEIPVTVSGTPASAYFLLYTKDQGESINPVQNGFLGWHFVNKIDTCVYLSGEMNLGTGTNQIVWDGKDSDGNAVPKGEYTYYLWGFDNQNTKVSVAHHLNVGGGNSASDGIYMLDKDGNPLAQPEIYAGGHSPGMGGDTRSVREHYKWIIGSDPEDATLIETSSAEAWADNSPIALLPTDPTMWFKNTQTPDGMLEITKYKWVPNGPSVIQTEWGESGKVEYPLSEFSTEYHGCIAIPGYDGEHIIAVNQNFFSVTGVSELIYFSLDDGSQEMILDLSDWWIDAADNEAGGQLCGGPTNVMPTTDFSGANLHLSYHGSCVQQVIDPHRDGDINDKTLWVNQNGDYIFDKNWEEDSDRPWVCNDYNATPIGTTNTTDGNGFSIVPCHGIGAVSFGLFAPDGTGISYGMIAGETDKPTWALEFVDTGCAYDGLYTDSASNPDDPKGWWFVAHDSIKGVITSVVNVEEDAPTAFAVAQNSPNPFNPATTISFSIAEAGNVAIDVFNVAGQKVDTIADEFMGAGNHTVSWDGSGFSAGVYFYTVKSGDFSRTMKMTLLK